MRQTCLVRVAPDEAFDGIDLLIRLIEIGARFFLRRDPYRKHFDIEAYFAKPGKVGLTVPGELRDILPREDSLDDVVVGVHNQGIEVEFPVIALTGAEPHDRPEKDEREGRSQQTLSE